MVATDAKIRAFLAPRPASANLALRKLADARAAPETAAPVAQAVPGRPSRADQLDLSPDARRRAAAESSASQPAETAPGRPTAPSGEPLSGEEQRKLDQMKKRDAEVRAHEQAHVAAAGALFRGGPTYETEKGPDGNDYAVAGSVSIDSDPVPGDPEATIAKMQQVRRAALAPADPSSTDRRVAAQASRAEAEARRELAQQQTEEQGQQGGAPSDASPASGPGDPPSEFLTGYTAAGESRALEFPRLLDLAA